MWLWVVIVVGLSLLPFFQFFKKGDPHQLAAIAELEKSIDQDLLSDEAEWFEMWKTSGIHQEVYGVPYYNQMDSLTGYGYRECFDAAAAMVVAFHHGIRSQDAYRHVRRKFGDTTAVHAQVSALRSLGLDAEFRRDARVEDIELEIDAGRPILVGWLHRGDLTKGQPAVCDSEGCGHWSVIVGYNTDEFIAMDPMGKPYMETGGHNPKRSGELIKMSRPAFYQRFLIEGEASGWAVFVDR